MRGALFSARRWHVSLVAGREQRKRVGNGVNDAALRKGRSKHQLSFSRSLPFT